MHKSFVKNLNTFVQLFIGVSPEKVVPICRIAASEAAALTASPLCPAFVTGIHERNRRIRNFWRVFAHRIFTISPYNIVILL